MRKWLHFRFSMIIMYIHGTFSIFHNFLLSFSNSFILTLLCIFSNVRIRVNKLQDFELYKIQLDVGQIYLIGYVTEYYSQFHSCISKKKPKHSWQIICVVAQWYFWIILVVCTMIRKVILQIFALIFDVFIPETIPLYFMANFKHFWWIFFFMWRLLIS